MIKRRQTTIVKVGKTPLGSTAPVAIQSMTKTPTIDVQATLRQIEQLAAAGCLLVRVAVPTKKDSLAFAQLVKQAPVPLIADIHFSPDRAIEAIEAGAAKIRLNPGNIKKTADILRIIEAAKSHDTAIRIGVNEASIRDLKTTDIQSDQRVALMLEEMTGYVKIFEDRCFEKIVLSAKSADSVRTIEINRLLAENFPYPLHLGLTHAGLPEDAAIPSAVTLGTLLAEGIGDTIRVSAAGDPVIEAQIATAILKSLHLRESVEVDIVVCPTCARAQIDVVALARKVKAATADLKGPLRIAVMGCIVNGPGEAADADAAICAAKGKGYIYKNGKKIATVPEHKLVEELISAINS